MIEAKKFASIRALDGISERTMTEHYKLYEGYVKKTNEIMELLGKIDLASANQIYSPMRAKVELSFAIGGVRNHELYFSHLGGEGGEPTGELLTQLEKEYGSFANWQADLKATGLAGRGWAWLCVDHEFKRLINYIGDAQNSFPIWRAEPILALDVYEHAYYLDFGVKRADYIDTFFKNLDWKVVEENFRRAVPN
jgi:Fe-Mn family superoxide dismutase